MGDVIDFQSRRGEILRRKADEYAASAQQHEARLGWLKRNGASLADQVRSSLGAQKAHGDHCEIERALTDLQDGAPASPHA